MTTDLTYQGLLLDKSGHTKLNLQSGEAVIYGPYGSGKVFVLSAIALYVYDLYAEGRTYNEILQSKAEPGWEGSLKAITQFLLEEGLFYTKLPRQISSTRPNTHRKSLSLWIHVTDVCNLDCDYCYVHKGKRHLSKEACDALVIALKHDVDEYNINQVELKFAGGEPLVDVGIIAYLIEQAKAVLEPLGVNIRLAIITNGTLVSLATAQFLKYHRFSVMVSLDGLGEYNNARKYVDGRPSLDAVIQGIETLLVLDIKPTILTTVSDTNVEGLWELMQYVKSLNLTLSLSLSRDYEPGVGLKMNEEHVATGLNDFLDKVCALSDDALPMLSFNGLQFSGRKNRNCNGGASYFAIDPNACVGFCNMGVDNPMGNVADKNSVLAFANRPENDLDVGDCNTCHWKHVCCGGCAILAMKAGTIGNQSVQCSLMKRVLPFIMLYEGRKMIKS